MQNQSQDTPWSTFDSSKSSDEDQGLDFWGFLQRRKAFIILLAMVGAGLGYLYFRRQTQRFSSVALVQVIHPATDPRVESLLAEQSLGNAQFEITSRVLLEECYNAPHGLKTIDRFNNVPMESVINQVAGMITARSPSPTLLHIYCECENGADTMAIANAVANTYADRQKENYDSAEEELKRLLGDATGKLQSDIDKAEEDYREWEKTSPLDSSGENPHTKLLVQIQSAISSLVIRETELQAELLELQKELEKGGPRDALLMLVGKQSQGQVGDTPENAEVAAGNAKNLFQSLLPLLMEEASLAEQVGAGHPKLMAIRKRIELMKKHFEMLAGMEPDTKSDDTEKPVLQDFLTTYVTSLEKELQILVRSRESLNERAKVAETEAKKLREAEHQRQDWERKRERLSSVLDAVEKQIAEMPVNQLGGVKAEVLNKATPGTLSYPMLPQFLGLGAFLGGFVGLILGYIVEAADRSFRKPEEIIREFGIPIVGHIPYMQEQKLRKIPKDTVIDRTVISLHLPRSRPSEAYRSVRTAVCFSAQGKQHRVIQVTSPAAGDGKSTLAMNFAISLAQSGKKTIIIESDFRRPKVHRLTGVDNSVGVVDVLRGKAELTDAIQDTELEGFFVMPCGSRPRNPSELLARPEYEDLLSLLREKFDYVIIDTPPVLVVTDPCSVAPRVDGVLLCVRLSRHTREFGRRSLEQLRDVGAKMSGIVVNGVEETDAYGYGNYSYSDYRYRYKDYSYNYGYGEKQNEAYFAESDSESEPEETATQA